MGYGPGTKGNFSTFYPTPEAAARALWTWAGADWQARVLQKEMPQHRQDPQQAAPDPDMSLPLNEAEEEIIRVLRWTSRKNRKSRGKKNEYFQFTYKKSFGPGGSGTNPCGTQAKRWLPGPCTCGPKMPGNKGPSRQKPSFLSRLELLELASLAPKLHLPRNFCFCLCERACHVHLLKTRGDQGSRWWWWWW